MNNVELWTEFKTSPSTNLKQQIMINYTNLVHYVIYQFRFINHDVLEENDYFQFGVEGLSEAIDRFDPQYGTKFETYAIQRIRGKILDEIRKIQNKTKYKSEYYEGHLHYKNVSMNHSINKDDVYQLYETIEDKSPIPDEEVEKLEQKELLKQCIRELDERKRMILSLYYYEGLNYQDIAEVLNVSVSRVSQIHTEIIKKLKTKLESFDE